MQRQRCRQQQSSAASQHQVALASRPRPCSHSPAAQAQVCSLVSPKARLTMGRGAMYRLLPHRRKGPTGLPAESCTTCSTCPPAASIRARSSGLQAEAQTGRAGGALRFWKSSGSRGGGKKGRGRDVSPMPHNIRQGLNAVAAVAAAAAAISSEIGSNAPVRPVVLCQRVHQHSRARLWPLDVQAQHGARVATPRRCDPAARPGRPVNMHACRELLDDHPTE